MPSYEVTTPSGKKYRVDAPEGATLADAIAYVAYTYPDAGRVARAPKTAAPAAAPQQNALGRVMTNLVETARPYVSAVNPLVGAAMLKPETLIDPAAEAAANALGTTRTVLDVFGANEDTAQYFQGATQRAREARSVPAQERSMRAARTMQDAEGQGFLKEAGSAVKAFTQAPGEMLAGAVGSIAPIVAIPVAASFAGAPTAVVGGIGTGLGALSGLGTVKGSIYDAVRQELSASGVDPRAAELAAREAQAYGGENLSSILTGGALGAIAGRTGVEKTVLRGVFERVLGRAAAQAAGESAERSVVGAVARGAASEGATEGLQGGQERYAVNRALQNVGYAVPTWEGVAGQGVSEGLVGALLGGAAGPLDVNQSPPATNAPGAPPASPAPGAQIDPDASLSSFEQAVAEIQARRNIPREDAEAMVRMTMPEPEQVEDAAGTDTGGLGAGVPSPDGEPAGGRPTGQPADAGRGDVGAAGGADGAPDQRAELVESPLIPPSMTDEEMLNAFEARDQEQQETPVADITPPVSAPAAEVMTPSPEPTPQLPEPPAAVAEPLSLEPAAAPKVDLPPAVDPKAASRILERAKYQGAELVSPRFRPAFLRAVKEGLGQAKPLLIGGNRNIPGWVEARQYGFDFAKDELEREAQDSAAVPVTSEERLAATTKSIVEADSKRGGKPLAIIGEPKVVQVDDKDVVAVKLNDGTSVELSYDEDLLDNDVGGWFADDPLGTSEGSGYLGDSVEEALGKLLASVERDRSRTLKLAAKTDKTVKPTPTSEPTADLSTLIAPAPASASASAAPAPKPAKKQDQIRAHPAVESVDDGGPGQFFVNLKPGFQYSEQRSFGAENATEALKLLKSVEQEPAPTPEPTIKEIPDTPYAPAWQALQAFEAAGAPAEAVEQLKGQIVGYDKLKSEGKTPAMTPDMLARFITRRAGQLTAGTKPAAEEFKNIMPPPLVGVGGAEEVVREATKVPSLSRKVDKLVRLYEGELISGDELADAVSYHARAIERARFDKRDRQAATPRQRGADYIRQRLLEAKRRGDISDEAADLAEWFIQRNPALVDDLGISVRQGTDRVTAGSYNPTARIMTLIKETGSTATGVHEIMHHLERMLPGDVQTGIRTSWLKALTRAERAERGTPNPFMVEFFRAARAGDTAKASELVADGKVGYRFYQYVNPSEFWAVNASRIVQGEFDVRGSTLGKLKKWLADFAARIQQVLGLPSDYPLLRALRSLAASDGRFVSDHMLSGPGARDYRMYIGAEAAERFGEKDIPTNTKGFRPLLQMSYQENLDIAKDMEEQGKDATTIRNATGWFRNTHDGKWRFEINDTDAKFNTSWENVPEDVGMRLGYVFSHPQLFALYPELANVTFVKEDLGPNGRGLFDETENVIVIAKNAEDPVSVLLHEVMHWVQGQEGFARGANADDVLSLLNDTQKDGLVRQVRQTANQTLRRKALVVQAIDYALQNKQWQEWRAAQDNFNQIKDTAPREERWAALDRIEGLKKAATKAVFTARGVKISGDGKEAYGAVFALEPVNTSLGVKGYRERAPMSIDRVRRQLNQLNSLPLSEAAALAMELSGDKYNTYKAVAGEIEARDVQARYENARKFKYGRSDPLTSEAYPKGTAIVHYNSGPVGSIATPSQKAAKKSQEKLTLAAKKVANAAASAGALGYDNSAPAKELIDAFSGNIKARDAEAFVDEAATQPLSGWPVPVLNTLVPQIPSADIVRWAKTEGLELDPAYRLITEMAGYHGRLQRASTRLGEDFNSWISKNGSDVMSATMHYARLAGLSFSSTGDRATALQTDPELVKLRGALANAAPEKQSAAKAQVTLREKDIRKGYDLWDALGQKKGGHEMYRQVHQYYEDMYNLSRALIKQRIEGMGLKPKDEAKLWQTVRLEMEQARDKGDYFPLMRHGKYYAYYKTSPVGRIFETFDTEGERSKAIARYQKDFGIKPGGQGSNVNEVRDELASESAMLRAMLDAVRKQSGGKPNIENLLDDTYQMFLQFLPERSLRKQFIHTKNGGVAGFSSDVARNFANMAGRYASQLPKLKYAHKVQAALNDADDTLKGRDPGLSERLGIFSGEVRRRAEQEFNPEEPNAALSVLNRATATFLLSGGATAMAQMIAIPQRVLPHLTRYYGFGPTNRMALKYMQFWKMVGVNFGDFGRQGFGPSIGDSAYIKNNPVLKEIFDAGQDQFGLFESNASHYLDTAPSPTTPTGGLRGLARDATRAPVSTAIDTTKRVADVTSRALMWTFSVSERLVNQQTYMMAAELELAKSGNKEKAKEAGVRAITDAIGRYQRYERPQIMRGTLGPTLTMFKMYPVHTTSFFIRNAATVAREMSGGDPKAARAAALEMGYVLAMTGVFAGAVGMPLYSTLMMVTDLVIKSMDDEEEEAERLADDPFYGASADLRFRYRTLPNLFGDNSVELGGRKIPLSDIVRDGLVPTLTDAGIGSRASLDGIWFRAGQGDSTPSVILNTIAANLPGASFVTNFGRGYDLINQGEVEKGLEAMLPAGARNLMRASRFGEEGITTNRGDPILEPDEFTDANFLAQVLGLPVQRIAGRMDAGRKVKARTVQLGKERQTLLRRFNKLGRDPQTTDAQLDKLSEDILQFNATVSGVPKLIIDQDALNNSWTSFGKRPVADGYVLDPRLGAYELEVLQDASSPE